jgi:phosphoglycolate phosphatase
MNYFFDLDGTLIDSKQRLYKLFCYLNSDINISYENYWDLKKQKISHREILINRIGYTDSQFLVFQNEWMSEIENKKWLKFDQPFEGMSELLNTLSKNNTLFLVTARQSKRNVLEQIKNFGWLSYFKEILVTRQKVEKYQLILKHTKVSPNDYIIGDTGKDIETGKKLGIRTIAVLSGFLSENSLLKYKPDYILENAYKILNNENSFFKF